jgi:hypothetical protein
MSEQSERLHARAYVSGMLASMSTRGIQSIHGYVIQDALADILPAVKEETEKNQREIRFTAGEDKLHSIDEQILALFRAGDLQRSEQEGFLNFCFQPGNVEKYICALHLQSEFLHKITTELIDAYERRLSEER